MELHNWIMREQAKLLEASGRVGAILTKVASPGYPNCSGEEANLVWVVIRGSLLNQRSELHIGLVYISSEGSPHSNLDCFTNICELVANRFRRAEVIICGERNAHTGNLLDYVPMQVLNEASYIHNIKPNEYPGFNVDKIIDKMRETTNWHM